LTTIDVDRNSAIWGTRLSYEIFPAQSLEINATKFN
jgi:hypothetical protein